MKRKLNIFIEGIPGSGKSTLFKSLRERLLEYNFYEEGDISPIELAWCAYMTKDEYEQMIQNFPLLINRIQTYSNIENQKYIVAYTKIHTDNIEFYKYMEKFEIYGGRREINEFHNIVINRFRNFSTSGNIFECSFLQNIMDELMLFAMYDDEQIIKFYKNIIQTIDLNKFFLIRLKSSKIRESILQIKKERINEKDEEGWYNMMMEYLNQSPYGKTHQYKEFDDLLKYFNRRISTENKIIELLPKDSILEIESKKYNLETIISKLYN